MGPALLSDELVAPPEFRDGRIVMSDRPGLGMEWNEDLIEHTAAVVSASNRRTKSSTIRMGSGTFRPR